MTLDELIEVCKKTKWELDSLGRIRTKDNYAMCPLCYTVDVKRSRYLSNGLAHRAAGLLHMNDLLVDVIMAAADGKYPDDVDSTAINKVRKKLLELVEKAG